ncbi:MAG TPA: hypothetical protein VM537_22850 [Anaerolineae bacterium]|nr:hypothetical protein [Anaerolineae bacterium]
MRNRPFAAARLGLVVIVVGCSVSCLDITVDGGPVPTPTFPIESLLLDESAFPEGWVAYEPHEPKDGFGLSVCIHYSPPATSAGGIALHAAYIARSPEEAVDGYGIWAPFWFSDREGWSAWSAPGELQYRSLIADQFRFACSREEDDEGRQVCQAVGQYGRYMTRFHTFMNPDTMTPKDLGRILIAIDERMALYLEKDTQ